MVTIRPTFTDGFEVRTTSKHGNVTENFENRIRISVEDLQEETGTAPVAAYVVLCRHKGWPEGYAKGIEEYKSVGRRYFGTEKEKERVREGGRGG